MPPRPTRLSQILKHLQKEPIPTLPGLRSLRLTYAYRNGHWGARHFVKDDLPRIAYANPSLNVVLEKKMGETLKPVMELEFHDDSQQEINMDGKLSDVIFTELLDLHTKYTNAKSTNTTGEQPAPLNLTAEA